MVTKILISSVGLLAVVLPIVLIVTNFNLVSYFYHPLPFQQPVSQSNQNEIESTNEAMRQNIKLLNKDEFLSLENSTDYLVVNLDNTLAGQGKKYLSITSIELKTMLGSQENLATLFKTQKIILATTDIVNGEPMVREMMKKGLIVAVYINGKG